MHSKEQNPPLPCGFKPPHLISKMNTDSSVLVGFSGGADSTAMLYMLALYAKSVGAVLYAAHLNHGIRGDEADRDESFCREFAEKLGIRFISKKVNIPLIAEKSKESIESAARRIRYEFFDEIMHKHDIHILATAHNADDNLETMIFNLARGAGLRGICGIPESRPCKNGIVIRPILAMEKAEIIEYCRRNRLDFVTDSTNTDTDYTRNKIRSEIIPVMRQINAGAVKNAYRTSQNLYDDLICLEELTDNFTDELNGGCEIDCKKLSSAPISVVNRALMHIYKKISDGAVLEATHINALRELALRAVPHSAVSLPNDFEGAIENKKLYIRKKAVKSDNIDYSVVIFEGENFISQTNCKIFIGNSHNAKNIYKKSILLSIDSAKINGELVARSRQSGDKIKMNGMSKSVKKLMCDKKVPLDIRGRLPIICDNNGILAVPMIGIRDGVGFKNDKNDNTKTDIIVNLV